MKKRINWKILILSFFVVFLTAYLGSLLTDTGQWYENIKPSITPPSFVFPIVWNILFILIAISLYFALTSGKNTKLISFLFGINLLLNFLWSFLFFYLKQPSYSLIEIIFLWLSILLLIIYTWNINKTSSYLLIPYLLWVTFATLLNYLMVF